MTAIWFMLDCTSGVVRQARFYATHAGHNNEPVMSSTEGRVLNNQGEIMDAPAFDATGFVRPALLTIALYLLILVIPSMTMAKPAHASGSVTSTSTHVAVVRLWLVH